jgi:hypothetical protein
MEETMQKFSKIGGLIMLSGFITYASAFASTVEVINENKKDLDVVIEPGEGTILPNKQEVKFILKAGEHKTVDVSRTNFPDHDSFVVTGKVKIPSIYNKCGPMNMNKDYVVVYTSTDVGATACHYSVK